MIWCATSEAIWCATSEAIWCATSDAIWCATSDAIWCATSDVYCLQMEGYNIKRDIGCPVAQTYPHPLII